MQKGLRDFDVIIFLLLMGQINAIDLVIMSELSDEVVLMLT